MAAPPDLSLMAKARENGLRYMFSLLTGYPPSPPAGLTIPAGRFYNPYFPSDLSSAWTGKGPVPKGGFIAMPFQLTPNRVTYDDGTAATTDQEAKDVVAFLAWSAEPHADERKDLGLAVMIYLLIFTGVLYVSYRTLWRNIKH
jgi:ubiquinol-cytochrome c reductase cytochrome c1 subunit